MRPKAGMGMRLNEALYLVSHCKVFGVACKSYQNELDWRMSEIQYLDFRHSPKYWISDIRQSSSFWYDLQATTCTTLSQVLHCPGGRGLSPLPPHPPPPSQLSVAITLPDGSNHQLELNLAHPIEPSKCRFKVLSTKVCRREGRKAG